MIARVLFGAILLTLLGYGIMEALPLLHGPSLTIGSPQDGAAISDGVVEITGNVLRTTGLAVNGTPLLPDEQGAFRASLAFPHGTSILKFTAADRFGRKITETRTIFIPTYVP
jgi:uncharacterized protein YfaP (DUF2135 family)